LFFSFDATVSAQRLGAIIETRICFEGISVIAFFDAFLNNFISAFCRFTRRGTGIGGFLVCIVAILADVQGTVAAFRQRTDALHVFYGCTGISRLRITTIVAPVVIHDIAIVALLVLSQLPITATYDDSGRIQMSPQHNCSDNHSHQKGEYGMCFCRH